MSDFHTRQSSLDRALLDPAQHVHFAQGMVLGTDDFNQEFAWLSGRDRWAMRAAIGYGTVTGLRVSFGQNGSSWEVRVGPGVAVTPAGHLVRVAREQCADLAAWIDAHPEALSLVTQPDGGVATVRLRVMLNYRECLTDPVPVAGDACRTEEDSLQPSRVTDDFTLELAREDADPPTPREEDAVRWLVAWLRDRIELAGTSDSPDRLEGFLGELREEACSTEAPRRGDPVVSNTTPEGDDRETPPSEVSYRLSQEDAARFVREALRVWVVELRERWHRDRFPLRHGPRPTDQRPIDEPVLLAVLRVPLARDGEEPWMLHQNAALTVAGPDPAPLRLVVDESSRPWLLHLRMLQELVLQQMHLLPPPGDSVVAETAWGQESAVGGATAYSRADHTHGTPTPTGDVTADDSGELRVRAIQHHAVSTQPPESGDVLVWTPASQEGEEQGDAWVPTRHGNLSVHGDVTGSLDATSVVALQGRAVADEDPDANDLLAWQGTEGAEAWRPFDRGALPLGNGDLGDVVGTLREPRVQGLQNRLVASTAPGDGQVLTFRGGMWQPEAPTVSATLEGDVVTEETEGGTRTRVVALQGGPLAVGNPPPAPD